MKKLLFFFFILCPYFIFAQFPAHLPTSGLIAWYPFNGNANDESGFANHASLGVNISPTVDRYGIANAAYKFVGMGTISVPPSNYTPFDSSFTISLWFRSVNQNRQQPLNINDGNAYISNLNFAFNNSGGTFAFWNSQGANNIICGSMGQYTDGFWHNMVFLREDSIVKLYFDGVLGGTKKYKLPIGNNSSLLLSNGSYAWDGDLDDLAIYNRALTPAEIDTLNDITYHPIEISTPYVTDAFPVGYADTIRWVSLFSISKVKLEYSVDSGNTWYLIKDSVTSSLRKYIWTTPNLPGKTCQIKISNVANPAEFGLSAKFLISRYQWQLITNNGPFSVRDGAGAYSFKDSMYLVGGWNPLDPVNYPLVTNNEVWRSADGLNWTLISTGPWEARHTFGSLIKDNKMWIVGGDELQNRWQKEVWNSPDGVNWTLLSDSVPWGDRMTHMTCVYNNKLWVMGGQKIVGWSNVVDTAYNDVWNSSDGINWTQVTQHAAWSPRAQIEGQCIFDNKMWILGGGTYNGVRNFYNDVWNSSDGVNWNLVTANAPWAVRQYNEVMVYDSAIWVLDGYGTAGNRNDVWYSYNGTDWHQLLGTPWPPRHASSIFNHDKSLWVVAGNLLNDVWRLNNMECHSLLGIQPADDSVYVGYAAQMICSSTLANSSFQWQIDSSGAWLNLSDTLQFSGAQNDTLLISNCTLSNNANHYRCIIQNGFCADTTNGATLSVTSDVGIHMQVISNSEIKLYPNPANDFVYVKVKQNCLGQAFEIIDVYGKTCQSGKIPFEQFKINTSDLPTGLYLLKVGQASTKTFEIQRR